MGARSAARTRRHRILLITGALLAVVVVIGLTAVGIARRDALRPELEARFPARDDHAQPAAQLPEPAMPEVLDAQPLSERTTRYRLTSEVVPAEQTQDGPSAVVTLPQDYDESREYPVVYLLTGTDGQASAQDWYDNAALEDSLGDLQAIAVAVDDGAYGWYTDWSGPTKQPQGWRTHHLEEVLPWVDQRYPTIAAPGGRAVVGASAGGYGAVSYAEQRPDLFGAAVSMSGLLSFDATADRKLVLGEAAAATGEGSNLFGDGQRTTSADWDSHDPSLHTQSLTGMPIWLYSGSGDEFEARLQETTETFAASAEASGAAVRTGTYEQLIDDGARMPAGTCSAGHEWTCWSMALVSVAPQLQDHFDRSV
ncbi:esterase family protein [Kocuria sp. p3-SID1433]|uniref:alpha/beta hydrolase n=1 Tax=unclassified Kocuria TaxID=2649579 RepID=UPI0021A833C6|nr:MULTISPECIES: esterase family protein [unclassified Kocuria]MCT1602195.1 esterase family protein [Kocuria sp. p3-SID1428]MCT2179652.1 esterase family protein [Kocuria sp. p3-SID1433]